jgi:hypothetical protein
MEDMNPKNCLITFNGLAIFLITIGQWFKHMVCCPKCNMHTLLLLGLGSALVCTTDDNFPSYYVPRRISIIHHYLC